MLNFHIDTNFTKKLLTLTLAVKLKLTFLIVQVQAQDPLQLPNMA